MHLVGNQHADRLAGVAAQYAQLTRDITDPIVETINRAKKIQLRLANIICNLPARPKFNIPKVQTVPKPSLDELMECSTHEWIRDGSRAVCRKCNNNIILKSPTARKLIISDCRPVNRIGVRPIPIPTQLCVGNQVSHPSHRLFNLRGLVYCRECGCMAGKVLRRLAAQVYTNTVWGAFPW